MAKKNVPSTVITTASRKDFYSKAEVIRALRWATGMSKTVAETMYGETCAQFHNLTVMDYRVYGQRRSVR